MPTSIVDKHVNLAKCMVQLYTDCVICCSIRL